MTTRILSSIAILTVFATLAIAGPGGSGYPHLTGPGNGGGYLTDGPGLGGGYLHLLSDGPGGSTPYLTDGPGLGGGYLLDGPQNDGKPTL